MLSKNSLFFSILVLCININNISSQCIPNTNCPYGQGNCVANACVCVRGYQTFISQGTTEPVFCNYKQTNKWIPIILELFLPSIGLFYLGRYFHAFIKLALLLPVLYKGTDVSLIFGILFVLMYFLDIFLLSYGIISDGYGFPLI